EQDRIRGLLDADLVVEFDPTGDGRAVVAWGDPERTDTVATFVPGMSSSLATMGSVMADARALHDELGMLVDDRIADADTPTSATIAWLGYDAPSGLLWGAELAVDEVLASQQQGQLIAHA